jgi:polyhydroxyalkanoate synthesis regulator phasin
MLRLVKKTAFIGLGLAAMSVAALEQLGGRIAKEANLSEEEGKKLVDDLIEQSKNSREDMKKMFEQTMRDYMTNMNIVTTDDLKPIEKRLENIEKSLNKSNHKTAVKSKEK